MHDTGPGSGVYVLGYFSYYLTHSCMDDATVQDVLQTECVAVVISWTKISRRLVETNANRIRWSDRSGNWSRAPENTVHKLIRELLKTLDVASLCLPCVVRALKRLKHKERKT